MIPTPPTVPRAVTEAPDIEVAASAQVVGAQVNDPGGDRTHDLLIKSPFLAREIALGWLRQAPNVGHSAVNCARGRARSRAHELTMESP